MKKKYRTKIGLEIVGFLLLVFLFMGLIGKDFWVYTLIPMGIVTVIFIFAFKGISYTVTDNLLIVHASLMPDTKIEISSIRKIAETNNPLSSPAGSLDRIEIFYNKFDSVITSPVETEDFISRLQKINPDIEIKRMEKKTIFSKLAV